MLEHYLSTNEDSDDNDATAIFSNEEKDVRWSGGKLGRRNIQIHIHSDKPGRIFSALGLLLTKKLAMTGENVDAKLSSARCWTLGHVIGIFFLNLNFGGLFLNTFLS